MEEYLYIVQKLYAHQDTIFIDSTSNLLHKLRIYIENECSFNNSTHNVWSFKIIKSNLSCYQLDIMIRNMSSSDSIPFVKFDNNIKLQHYYFTDIEKLSNFLDKLNVKYELKKENLDEITKVLKNIKKGDALLTQLNDDIAIEKLF
jgi:hypothetical protein